jgi:hypothetical protein
MFCAVIVIASEGSRSLRSCNIRRSCCFTVTEFPAFLDYYRQLRDADPAYASKCNAHWRLFMQGPPNRPNKDDYGLINVVVQFFKSCDQGHY